jgi:hypothetical protein
MRFWYLLLALAFLERQLTGILHREWNLMYQFYSLISMVTVAFLSFFLDC